MTTSIHDIQNNTQDLNLAPGLTALTEIQRKHVGVVLDLFQAKGTMAKLNDWFIDDAVYEDLFATCKNREEIAGQMLGLPIVTISSKTLSHTITKIIPSSTTTDGQNRTQTGLDEIDIKVKHVFKFKPLGNEVEMNSTWVIFSQSQEKGGKIVRLQDRPMEEIPENALLSMMRKMNAVVAPHLIGIPKTEEQDQNKMEAHQAHQS